VNDEYLPPGHTTGEEFAAELADLVVVDGPNAGDRWTYVASQGGYLPADGSSDVPMRNAAAVIDHVGGNVRPIEEES
jgi:hypothetical protein